MQLNPVILSGGSGTRLWPFSRDHLPKQFLSLFGGDTMFQATLGRLDCLRDVAEPIVVCNDVHRYIVDEQMKEANIEPLEVIVEPIGRNTAPALTLAALSLRSRYGADPVMVVMPADHLVQDKAAFHKALMEGAFLAENGLIVTLGVLPTHPSTAYGYIEMGEVVDSTGKLTARRVTGFVEKPEIEIAKGYVGSARWLWNSGIFLMKVSVWLSELARHRPDIYEACRSSMDNGGREGIFYSPGVDEFRECPEDSIDYAVMEGVAGPESGGAASSAVIPIDVGWSDVGSWSVIWEVQDQDPQGNVVHGDVYTTSTEDTLLISQHRLLATVGIRDMVIVDTPDALLVARKDRVQDVKKIVQRLQSDGRDEHVNHRKVNRPWGSYQVTDSGPGFQVKRLTVKAGAALSLQKHKYRAEHWVVVTGTAKMTLGDKEFTLMENQSTYVPIGEMHRIENPGNDVVEIVEIQTGDYLGEDDIIRYKDRYGRSDG